MDIEEKLRKANRLYSFTNMVNQMIIRVKDEETLFKEACKIAVDVGQFRMAWVGMMDAETNRILPVMYAGVEMDYLSKIKIIYVFEDPEKNGPAATAFKEKRHVVCNDIQHDLLIAPWKDSALERGYRSSIGLPIFRLGEVIGVLSLYSSVAHYFDDAEIVLLRETAGNVSFAMDVFEKERQRKMAEEAVIRSEKKYQALAELSDSIINSLPGAFYLYTREGLFLRWNHNFESVTGYTAEEIKTMHPLDFFDTGEKPIIAGKIEEVFSEGQANVEANFLLKYGRKVPYYFTGRAIGYEGKPCLVGVGIDISQRVLAQEQMKETSEQLRQLAAHLQDIREDERAAIAREVHDELGQQLTGLKMDVYWLRDELAAGNNDIIIQIDSILKLTHQIINSVRKIASTLRPPILDDLGLEDAVRSYCSEFQGRYGVQVEWNINLAAVQLPPKVSIGLFRIFQESLTNVARHAEASKVFVSLLLKEQHVVLSIRDNGKGFNLEEVTKRRTLGLLGMKERVHMLDGKCLIRSHTGGTEIEVTVPLNKVLTS